MRRSLIAVFLFLMPFVADAQTNGTTATLPFGDGESLIYTASYRAALIPNINMARATITTVDATCNGLPHYHIVANGRTTSLAKSIFSLNNTYHVWLNSKTIRPTRMTAEIIESSYRFRGTYNYDWDEKVVNNVLRNEKWDADQYASFAIDENSGDAISLFFKLRTIDMSQLVVGKAYPLNLVLNRDKKPIRYIYWGKENIKVKKLGTFRALKFTCTMATSDGSEYEDGMELTIWISDDRNRIPLLLDTPVKVGSIRATLHEFNLLHPLDSKID